MPLLLLWTSVAYGISYAPNFVLFEIVLMSLDCFPKLDLRAASKIVWYFALIDIFFVFKTFHQ